MRYLAWLRTQGRADSYIEKVDDILKTWVVRLIGDVLVSEWGPEESQAVVAAARAKGLSPSRVEQIGVAMSGLRKTAWRKTGGVSWLSRTEDPLEGVNYSRTATAEGQHRDFVAPARRPTLAQVRAAIAAARLRDAVTGNSTALQVMVAAFCGLRLGEQMALRAVDVFLDERELFVNGAWAQPRRRAGETAARAPYRKETKTATVRRVPYPNSMHADLVAQCAVALGLPAEADEALVIAAQGAERVRRAGKGDWWKAHVEPGAEHWLFPCAATGQPYKKEGFNDEWHRIVRLTKRASQAGQGVEWPRSIEYMNLRHHCATWWHNELGFAWEDVALFLGHDVSTCLAHYVRASDDSSARARERLAAA